MKVWSLAASICVTSFNDHTEKISNIMTMSDNKRILSADLAETIKLWRAESGEVINLTQDWGSNPSLDFLLLENLSTVPLITNKKKYKNNNNNNKQKYLKT